MDKYCGDCIYLKLDRDKHGDITGMHRCKIWNILKSNFDKSICSSYVEAMEKVLEAHRE